MKIAIAGGTGLIGKELTKFLIENGHEVTILTRSNKNGLPSTNPRYVSWLNDGDQPEKALVGVEAFVNLAGATINSRWTNKGKERIIQSRLNAVEEIIRIIRILPKKPVVLVNASAVGYYGTSETQSFTEESTLSGNDFLAETVKRWEITASKTHELGVRTVLCRFGVILDQKEGALVKMLLPYRLFAGGTIGTGRQWLSWIHLQDVVRGILFTIEHADLSGPINFTAPTPIRMQEFGNLLANVLNRPHWFPVPSFALRLLLGEMSILVLEGQRVLPEKLLDKGFHFIYPELHSALNEIFTN